MTSDLVTYLRALDTAICQRNEARAEIERQARHIEELREKIDAEGSCACSLDAPGDICAAHSPALMRARAEVERLRASLKPFAQLYLWPDDLGEDMATLLRSEADWCEATNEDADSDVFIKRRYIRAARAALEAKP